MKLLYYILLLRQREFCWLFIDGKFFFCTFRHINKRKHGVSKLEFISSVFFLQNTYFSKLKPKRKSLYQENPSREKGKTINKNKSLWKLFFSSMIKHIQHNLFSVFFLFLVLFYRWWSDSATCSRNLSTDAVTLDRKSFFCPHNLKHL